MLYQTLLTYKYDNGGRPEQINVDKLGDYPTEYVYRTLAGESRPKKVLISDLQSETSDYTIYCVDEEGETVRANKSRTLGSTWAGKMIRSYQERNPEQKTWFDMITVNTIAERDALQYDRNFEPESWVRVLNDENGESHEYVLAANRQFWVDTTITGLNQASGSLVRDELYSRLSSGYLFDTFGPSGQDKSVCDFVYAFAINGDLAAITDWTKTGDTARWDFGDGSPVLKNGVPDHTFVSGNNVVTVSVEDSFNTVTQYSFWSATGFVGAIPLLDLSNTVSLRFAFSDCQFSGAIPSMDFSNASDMAFLFSGNHITSIPDMNLDALTDEGNSIPANDMFFATKITNKIGTINIPKKITIFKMFAHSTITDIDVDLNLAHPESTVNEMYWGCLNVSATNTIENVDNLASDHGNDNRLYPVQPNMTYLNRLTLPDGVRKYDAFFFRNENTTNFFKHLPRITPNDWRDSQLMFITTGPIDDLQDHGNSLTPQSLNNLIQFIYDRRFITKGTNGDTPVVLNLQQYSAELLGVYRNVDNPRYANEFLYKLIENPDNEDISEYKVIYNLDGTSTANKVATFTISTSVPNELFEFSMPTKAYLAHYKPVHLNIDWGDGTSSQKTIGDLGSSTRVKLSKRYEVVGEYTITFSGIFPRVLFNNFIFRTSTTSTPFIKDIYFTHSGSDYTFGLFENLTSVERIFLNSDVNNEFILGGPTYRTFKNCTSLRYISPFTVYNKNLPDSEGASNDLAYQMFSNTGSIESVVINGMAKSFNIANNQLGDAALNALFEGLEDVTDDPQTITITGNPGIGVGVYDTTIATNKGWTVVDA